MGEKTQKIQQYKTEAVNAIKESIEQYSNFILTDFRGLNVDKITELRKKLRGISIKNCKKQFYEDCSFGYQLSGHFRFINWSDCFNTYKR